MKRLKQTMALLTMAMMANVPMGAQACVDPGDDIKIKGATFSETPITLKRRTGFALSSHKDQIGHVIEIPLVNSMKDIDGGRAKYSYNHKKKCWSRNTGTIYSDSKAHELNECLESDSVVLRDSIYRQKSTGIVVFDNEKATLTIYSVNEEGAQDNSKPSLVFSETTDEEIGPSHIYENGKSTKDLVVIRRNFNMKVEAFKSKDKPMGSPHLSQASQGRIGSQPKTWPTNCGGVEVDFSAGLKDIPHIDWPQDKDPRGTRIQIPDFQLLKKDQSSTKIRRGGQSGRPRGGSSSR